MPDQFPARRVGDLTLPDSCRVCGREAGRTLDLEGWAVHLCERCLALPDVVYRRDNNDLLMVRPDTGEIVASHPIVYSDPQFQEMKVEGRLGEWIQGASLQALTAIWEIAQEDKQRIQEYQYRIAAEFRRRLGFYGGSWAEEAAKVLRHHPDVVRRYASIWDHLGPLIEEDPRLLQLGFDLLQHAAASTDPSGTLGRYAELRDRGVPVKAILAGPGETDAASESPPAEGVECKPHDWYTVCRRCGAHPKEVPA